MQWSCLENPRDRGAWWDAIYGVAQSRTRLKRLSSTTSSMLYASYSSFHLILCLLLNRYYPHFLDEVFEVEWIFMLKAVKIIFKVASNFCQILCLVHHLKWLVQSLSHVLVFETPWTAKWLKADYSLWGKIKSRGKKFPFSLLPF